MRRVLVALAAALVAVPAAVVGSAVPASASNNVIYKIDPLNWNWKGDLVFGLGGCADETRHADRYGKCTNYVITEEVLRLPFEVVAGGGPQEVMAREWEYSDQHFVYVDNGVLTSGPVKETSQSYGAQVEASLIDHLGENFMSVMSPGDVPVRMSLTKFSGFYELKFFLKEEAPSLQSLRSVAGAALTDTSNCTIVGTEGDDTLVGTSGDDIICGLGGDDVILAGRGNDVILAGRGNDRIKGGRGHDRIVAGSGRDVVQAGRGNDWVSGDRGTDLLVGNKGSDWLHGGRGVDVMISEGIRTPVAGSSGMAHQARNYVRDVVRGDAGVAGLAAVVGGQRCVVVDDAMLPVGEQCFD